MTLHLFVFKVSLCLLLCFLQTKTKEGKGERKLKPMKSPSLLQIGTMMFFTEGVVGVSKAQSWQ